MDTYLSLLHIHIIVSHFLSVEVCNCIIALVIFSAVLLFIKDNFPADLPGSCKINLANDRYSNSTINSA